MGGAGPVRCYGNEGAWSVGVGAGLPAGGVIGWQREGRGQPIGAMLMRGWVGVVTANGGVWPPPDHAPFRTAPAVEPRPPEPEPTYQELRGARGDIYSSLTQ